MQSKEHTHTHNTFAYRSLDTFVAIKEKVEEVPLIQTNSIIMIFYHFYAPFFPPCRTLSVGK